jgi:hypothetical protein
MLTTRELDMLEVMNHITDKPDWEVKVGACPPQVRP